jgi:drug/metabolite transporter (DMT)-like permease
VRSRGVSPRVALNLAIVYVGWGSTYLAIRVMVRTIPPLVGAGVRFLVAGLILLAVVRLKFGRGAFRLDARALAAAALVGVLLPAGGNGLVTLAERGGVPSGLAALLVALEPLWVVVAVAAIGQRPTARGLAGVALGFGGVALLFLPGGGGARGPLVWMLVVVVAALSWAVGSVASSRLPMPANMWTATGIEMLVGGLVMAVTGFSIGEGSHLHPGAISAASLEALAFLVVAGSLVTFSAYVWLLRAAPIGLVSTYAFVNPLVAVALGAAFLSERLTPELGAAAAMIVAAVALSSTVRSRGADAARETAELPASVAARAARE